MAMASMPYTLSLGYNEVAGAEAARVRSYSGDTFTMHALSCTMSMAEQSRLSRSAGCT